MRWSSSRSWGRLAVAAAAVLLVAAPASARHNGVIAVHAWYTACTWDAWRADSDGGCADAPAGVVTVAPDGTGARKLPLPESTTMLAYAAGGRMLAFTQLGGGLFVAHADGTEVRAVDEAGTDVSGPMAWSPRAPHLLYPRPTESEETHIIRFNAATGHRVPVARGWHPVWSPGGSRVAFLAGEEGWCPSTVLVRVMHADGSHERTLRRYRGADACDVDIGGWSPSGGGVIVEREVDTDSGTQTIRTLVDTGSRTVRRLPPGPTGMVSPDGMLVATAAKRGVFVHPRTGGPGWRVLEPPGRMGGDTWILADWQPLP